MSRTITAFFDQRSEAEAAKARLTASRIDADSVKIVDQNYGGGGADKDPADMGFFESLKDFFLPDEDAHAYGEGIKRGGFLLTAQVAEEQADEAIAILDTTESVDFDKRQDEWRNDGWTGFAGGRTDTGAYSGAGMGASGQGAALGNSDARFENETRDTVDEQRIPIVEEELKVGKREVARGGARVRSYVRETPVHEQISLREEHVSVERRPVDTTLSAAELSSGGAFQDRTIEMTETAEEAVVAKEARVREELVIKKTAEERVEQIDDTVRRTEVDVDENFGKPDDRSAFGGFKDKTPGATGGLSDTERSEFERSDKDRY